MLIGFKKHVDVVYIFWYFKMYLFSFTQYYILAPNHHIRMISEGSFIHIIHIID